MAHVLRKLEVDDRAAAVDKALRLGLLTVGPTASPGPVNTQERNGRHHFAQHDTRRTTCEF